MTMSANPISDRIQIICILNWCDEETTKKVIKEKAKHPDLWP